MRYGSQDMTDMMGIGNYVGEVRRGPDGQVYQWVEGVDGLGNPIGLWNPFKAIKKLVVRLIPEKFKRGARYVCNTINQLEPVVQEIPPAAKYYAVARGFCGVLRGAGIAGVAEQEIQIPEAARQAAANLPESVKRGVRKACGFVDRLGPIVGYFPPIARPYQGIKEFCRAMRDAGAAGVGGGIMQAPDGRLYEVVEGIGAPGQARPFRRVWISFPRRIPALIRGRSPRGMGGRRAVLPAAPGARPVVIAPAAPGASPVVVAPAIPGARPVVIAPARPVRRFR